MKNHSTYAALLTDSQENAARLDAWLDERLVEQDISGMELPEEIALTRQDNRRLASDCGDYDSDIRAGQVRILSKRFTKDPDVIPFVAVLKRTDDDSWLIAPFSQYTQPALPGEMTTGIEMLGRRVIQAWNGQVIQGRLLEKSFLCGELDEKVREDALALYMNQKKGEPLPTNFTATRGPALVLEADPRTDYMAETVERLRPLATAEKVAEFVARLGCAAEKAIEGVKKIVNPETVAQPWYGSAECQLALAAGGKEVQTTDKYDVHDRELSLTYSPEEQMTIFTFYDNDDQPDPSYDGFAVLGAGFEFLGTFQGGTIRVPSDKVKDWFQIADPNGVAIGLTKKD